MEWYWNPVMQMAKKKLGLICFSTPFDDTALEFLEKLNVPAYKIASFENTHLPLIKNVALTGKPMIISTGMATIAELDETVQIIRDAGCNNFVLLKCTSTYPASPKTQMFFFYLTCAICLDVKLAFLIIQWVLGQLLLQWLMVPQ